MGSYFFWISGFAMRKTMAASGSSRINSKVAIGGSSMGGLAGRHFFLFLSYFLRSLVFERFDHDAGTGRDMGGACFTLRVHHVGNGVPPAS